MSYVVLARKYRPRNFAELVGQAHVVQALGNALARQRLHHAYLFTGTRGVGKTTVSRILAKSLNCIGADGSGGITAEPCGVCSACRDIDAGRHVDYVELDAASNRGVDEITQLLDQAVYKPVVGRFKVYMIDEVHMLSNTAFNAMLKTLEEPPEYLKFVLATTDPQKVPVTVLSRCLQFNLRPMAPDTVAAHLAHVLAAESVAADAGALRLLARAARGSMRDALSLADQAIAFGAGALQEDVVREMLGAVDRGHAERLIEALAAGNGAALLAQVDELRGRGLSAAGTLEELMRLAQAMAVMQAVPGAADADDPDAAGVARLAALLPPDETQLLYSVALHGRSELGLAPDEYSGLTMVLLRLLAFRPGGEGAAAGAGGGARAAAPAAVAATMAAADPAASTVPAATPARAASSLRQPHGATAVAVPRTPVLAAASAPNSPRGHGGVAAHAPVVRQETPPWEDEPGANAVRGADTAAVGTEPGHAAVDSLPAAAPAATTASDEPAWLAEAIDAEAGTPALAPTRVAPPAAAEAAPASAWVHDPGNDRWVQAVRALAESGAISALARELAWHSQCVADAAVGGTRELTLVVERETLRQDAVRERLQAALAQAQGQAVRLVLQAGRVSDSVALRDAAERARAQAGAEAVIRDDPLVQSLLREFKTARIVPGSVRPL